jgi:Tol biopolymer transport system component
VGIALALLATPSLAGKGGDKGKPGGGDDGGGGDPPPSANPRIVYGEYDGSQWLLKKANADGSNQTVVLNIDATHGVAPPDPSWSPDRFQIVFKAFDADGNALYAVDADGSNLRKIVAGSEFSSLFDPTWSPVAAPDGEYKIAFSGSLDGAHGQIHVCNTDGSELVNITNDSNRSEMGPAWSPDATRIAAGTSTTSALPRDINVYDLKVDGTTVARDGVPSDATAGTALEGARVNDLDWSPSGNVLLMAVDDEDDNLHDDLWTLDLDDSATVNLTATTGNNEREAAWSPDGANIVYRFVGTGKQRKNTGLHRMNADGSGKTSLGIAEGRYPDWR